MTTSQRERRMPVAVVRTQPETFLEDLLRAWRLAQPARAARSREHDQAPLVSIPSLAAHGPGRSVSPWSLAGVLELAQRASGREPSSVMGAVGDEPRHLARSGLDRVLQRAGLGWDAPREDLEIEPRAVDLPWLRGRRGGAVRVDARLSGRDAFVVGPLRRSRSLGIRGAVDATLAAVATPAERSGEPVDPEAWAELLRLRRSLHPSLTCILDATVCGSAEGLDRPIVADLLIVSRDPIACDVVAAHLMGLDPSHWSWLRRVAEATGTPLDLAALDLRGESVDARALAARERASVVARPRQRALTAPRAAIAVARLLDPARWTAPWRRRRWNELYRRTPWGRLHQDYREHGEARPVAVEPTNRQELA